MGIICSIILFSNMTLSTQMKEDLSFLMFRSQSEKTAVRRDSKADFHFRQTSELKLVFTGFIRLYQLFVSPQGPPSCNFTVTCSHFLSRAVKKYGFVHGLLIGSDRLTRCIRGGRKYYAIDPVTKKAIDYPVDSYYIGTSRRVVQVKDE
ncbi:MAG TPA: membrane protein insertion efficiency factor YidD [candidate division WOR-3 bacterium]|uniref:Membrane protein insertion efficiency factor YidD n=1 Tax=candidate division WOR-3 bacterium TaxID=2052148 RepID=A0A9C9EMJ4_UNCW3|nr:membrane protein insertion efficiency factor YidD [candidate division WOR-3 bacterium]